MFAVAAVLTAIGAASPAAVAIIAPIALGFAAQYNISAFLMGLMVIHGAQAGVFSPISVYGVIVNGVVSYAGLPQGEIALFLSSLIFNLFVGIVMFVLFGGLALMRAGRVSATDPGGGRGALPDLRYHVATRVVRTPAERHKSRGGLHY
jgi:hypothetical protein